MQPKSGKSPSVVTPAAPVSADEADVDDPGLMVQNPNQQGQTQQGNRGKTQAPRFKPAATDKNQPGQSKQQDKEGHYIEIELVDEQDNPVPGERYEIELPTGEVADGTLDENGFARVDKIPKAGTCKITFPDLDKDAWEPA